LIKLHGLWGIEEDEDEDEDGTTNPNHLQSKSTKWANSKERGSGTCWMQWQPLECVSTAF